MGYIEAASLEWLERGGIGRDEFVESVLRTLEAAVRTAS
jgi:hypothetical protein